MSAVPLHHVVEGPADAPTLVLASSLGTSLTIWDALLPELTGAFRVIRYDHRGHGGSPAPPGPYTMADLGLDVVALLDRLAVERASFCGVSLGGMVGMWLATHAAGRIDRLALVSTSAFLPPPEAWLARGATVRTGGISAIADAVVARWFTPSFAAQEPHTVAQAGLALKQTDPEGYASCCEAIATWDARECLGEIRAPTLVIAGGEDPATPPAHAYTVGAGIPGARVAVVEGAAHIVVLERPATIARLLLAHLGPERSPAGPAESDPDRDRSLRGEAVRRAVLGDAHVDRARANATDFSAPFQSLINRFPWGDIWTRPGLSRGERSIVTLTVLAAFGHDRELGMHVVAALRNGLTPTQIREVIMHVGAYAGIPAANRALAVAEESLAQAGALAGTGGAKIQAEPTLSSTARHPTMMQLDTPRVLWLAGDDIGSIVRRHARETPERIALVHGERSLTWVELDGRVDRVANALVASGLRPGDRVAVLASNSLEYAEVFLGTLRARACLVPLPTMASPPSLALMLADSAASALFVDGEHGAVGEALAGPAVALRVGIGNPAEDDGDLERRGFRRYAPWRDAAAATPALADITADDAFDVIYSSGTTGVPKGIVHSHGARKASYGGERARYFSRETVNVVATPFYSNTTSVTWLLTTAHGGTNVLLGKFSADAFIAAVEKHRATDAMLVPVQYDRLFASERFRGADLSSLRHLFSTSAPLRAETKRRVLDETSAELLEIYGLTEGGPVTVLEARRYPDKLASVGRPSSGCTVRIVDEGGRDVPRGQVGEVLGRSANMMSGYLNHPDDTQALLVHDAAGALFFRTGDLGRFDDGGFLYLLDRKKDVIISGGFNVYATDLETVLARHPSVEEVAVIGVPSERWGETPLALVVPRPGTAVTAQELRDYCNGSVGKAQRLSGVELRPNLPKNAIGKILKRELRAPYWR